MDPGIPVCLARSRVKSSEAASSQAARSRPVSQKHWSQGLGQAVADTDRVGHAERLANAGEGDPGLPLSIVKQPVGRPRLLK
jgi:hypothetical protein